MSVATLTHSIHDKDSRGWHVVFEQPITGGNFLAACNTAIGLAKRHCPAMEACAINFVAEGVEVQVVECSDAGVQHALWARSVEWRNRCALA